MAIELKAGSNDFAYRGQTELGDIERAQKHFQKVLEMEAPEDPRGLARNGLREITALELKARGSRMDAVFYLAGCHAALLGRKR